MTSLRLGLVAVGIESVFLAVVLSLESRVQTSGASIGLTLLQFPSVVIVKHFADWYYRSNQQALPMVILDAMMFAIQAICIWIVLVCVVKIVAAFKGFQGDKRA